MLTKQEAEALQDIAWYAKRISRRLAGIELLLVVWFIGSIMAGLLWLLFWPRARATCAGPGIARAMTPWILGLFFLALVALYRYVWNRNFKDRFGPFW